MKAWQLQEAKAKLSQVIQEAVIEPQEITLRGKPIAVILSKAEYDKFIQPKQTFLELLRRSPLVGMKLDLKRNKSKTRIVEL